MSKSARPPQDPGAYCRGCGQPVTGCTCPPVVNIVGNGNSVVINSQDYSNCVKGKSR